MLPTGLLGLLRREPDSLPLSLLVRLDRRNSARGLKSCKSHPVAGCTHGICNSKRHFCNANFHSENDDARLGSFRLCFSSPRKTRIEPRCTKKEQPGSKGQAEPADGTTKERPKRRNSDYNIRITQEGRASKAILCPQLSPIGSFMRIRKMREHSTLGILTVLRSPPPLPNPLRIPTHDLASGGRETFRLSISSPGYSGKGDHRPFN